MSDYKDVKIFQSLATDNDTTDTRPSLFVIGFAILFLIWLFS